MLKVRPLPFCVTKAQVWGPGLWACLCEVHAACICYVIMMPPSLLQDLRLWFLQRQLSLIDSRLTSILWWCAVLSAPAEEWGIP